MCEIAIMVHDVTNPDDPILDSQLFKRGDIIEVLENGADWGDEALTNPRFRMVRLNGVSVSAATQYLARELPTDPLHISPVLRQRMWSLDLNANIYQALSDFIADDTRQVPMLVVTSNQISKVIAALSVKTPLPDPTVIG